MIRFLQELPRRSHLDYIFAERIIEILKASQDANLNLFLKNISDATKSIEYQCKSLIKDLKPYQNINSAPLDLVQGHCETLLQHLNTLNSLFNILENSAYKNPEFKDSLEAYTLQLLAKTYKLTALLLASNLNQSRLQEAVETHEHFDVLSAEFSLIENTIIRWNQKQDSNSPLLQPINELHRTIKSHLAALQINPVASAKHWASISF